MDVNAIQQRSRYLRHIALNDGRGALAFAGAVVEISTRAWIHGRREHEPRRKSKRHGGTSNANRTIFQRLTHDFQDVAGKFGKFVEEKNTVMRERYFSRAWDRAAADQSCVGNRVVRRTKWTHANQSGTCIEHSGNAVDLGRLQRFLEGKWRQDGRHPFREHGLTRSWGPDHQNVVAARARNFECPLGRLLSTNIFKINRKMLRFCEQLLAVNA